MVLDHNFDQSTNNRYTWCHGVQIEARNTKQTHNPYNPQLTFYVMERYGIELVQTIMVSCKIQNNFGYQMEKSKE